MWSLVLLKFYLFVVVLFTLPEFVILVLVKGKRFGRNCLTRLWMANPTGEVMLRI